MSSSKENAGEFFVPDVTVNVLAGFVPEMIGATAPSESTDQASPSHVVGLDEYAAGPSEDELRKILIPELREQMQGELLAQRREDAVLLEALKAELDRSAQVQLDTIGRQAVELAYVVAERLVRARINTDPAVVERTLREAVGQIAATTPRRVRVHPDDAEFLRSMPELLEELKIEEVLDDTSQRRGGCLIESGDHAWDLTMISQLAHLHDALEQVLEGE